MITLLSDFGIRDEFIGAMKGVIYNLNPNVGIVDITHEIEPQSIVSAQYILNGYYSLYPRGTIHLAIVDPGVGSERSVVGIETDQYLFIAPDNGLLAGIIEREHILKTVRIDKSEFYRNTISNTFHGRDIFAPIVAHLSTGVMLESMGTIVKPETLFALKRENNPKIKNNQIFGNIIHIDHFGNMIANVKKSNLDEISSKPDEENIVILFNQTLIPFGRIYSEFGKQSLLALINNQNHLEISENCGNAARSLKAKVGDSIIIKKGEGKWKKK